MLLSDLSTEMLEQIVAMNDTRTLNISKDDLRMSEVQYMWTPELEKEVIDYWTALNKFWADRQIPPCTCHEQAGGFMAKEKWNPYWFNEKPCSVEYFAKFPELKQKWEAA